VRRDGPTHEPLELSLQRLLVSGGGDRGTVRGRRRGASYRGQRGVRRIPLRKEPVRPTQSAVSNVTGQPYVDLTDYLAVIRRRKGWVLWTILLGLTVAVLYSFLAPPTYESTARILVRATNVDPLEEPSEVDLDTERELVLSTAVAQEAQDELGTAQAVSELLQRVSVEIPDEAHVLTITYSAGEPDRAREGADAFAEGYLRFKRRQAEGLASDIRERLELRLRELGARIGDLTQDIQSLPQGEERRIARANLTGIQAEVAALRTRLASLTAVNTDPGEVIGAAITPVAPASPKLPLDVGLGLVAGSVLGVALALLRERTDPLIRGHLDLEKVLGVPALSVIPRIAAWKHTAEPVVIARDAPQEPAVEGYRLLRTHLLYAADTTERDAQITMVTSALPGEGKTATVANLGAVLAQSGQSTVLVSADLRRSRLHRFFGLRDAPGLTDVLSGRVSIGEALQPSGLENLWILGSGDVRAGEIELLRPNALRGLAAACAEELGQVDFLVVDSAPLLPVADSLGLMPAVDQVVVVVDALNTEQAALARCRELLEQVGAFVLGSLLNKYEPLGPDRYEGYGYGYALPDGAAGAGDGRRPVVRVATEERRDPDEPLGDSEQGQRAPSSRGWQTRREGGR
jgi:capsular exopolysaccharide synthesis family protein